MYVPIKQIVYQKHGGGCSFRLFCFHRPASPASEKVFVIFFFFCLVHDHFPPPFTAIANLLPSAHIITLLSLSYV